MSSVNHLKYNRQNDDHSILIDSDDLFEGENKSTSLKSINIDVESDSCLFLEELHSVLLGNINGKNHKSQIPLNPFINLKNIAVGFLLLNAKEGINKKALAGFYGKGKTLVVGKNK